MSCKLLVIAFQYIALLGGSCSSEICRLHGSGKLFACCVRQSPRRSPHLASFHTRMLRSLIGLICLGLSNVSCKATEPFFEKSVLFEEQTDGFMLYRIPGMVVTARGSVLAYCEARKLSVADRGEIEVHLRRSTDGGRTFSLPVQVAHLGPRLPRNPVLPPGKESKDMGAPNEQTVNNPVAIATRSGRVHLVYCVEYMRCFQILSDDDGLTWSDPVEITSALDAFREQIDWQAIATGPGHGIELSNGRLVIPVWVSDYRPTGRSGKAAATIYSDDGGETWHAGELAIPEGGEANVVELSDGSVMLTARNADPSSRRLASISRTGYSHWSRPRLIEELKEPGCMAAVTRYSISLDSPPQLLFSNLQTTKREHSARGNLTIHLSHDDGFSWPGSQTIESGPSAYSDLAVLPDGTILCFFESGTKLPKVERKRDWAYANLSLARFNLAWIEMKP